MKPRVFHAKVHWTVVVKYDPTEGLTDEDIRKCLTAGIKKFEDNMAFVSKIDIESIERVE